VKNYYVTTWPTFKLQFRGTKEECIKHAENLVNEWRIVGNTRMQYAVFYDTAVMPAVIIGGGK